MSEIHFWPVSQKEYVVQRSECESKEELFLKTYAPVRYELREP